MGQIDTKKNQNGTVMGFWLKQEETSKGKEPEKWVQVDGQDVPTSYEFWTQMMATGCRIDRSNTLSWISIVISVTSIMLVVLIAKGIL